MTQHDWALEQVRSAGGEGDLSLPRQARGGQGKKGRSLGAAGSELRPPCLLLPLPSGGSSVAQRCGGSTWGRPWDFPTGRSLAFHMRGRRGWD